MVHDAAATGYQRESQVYASVRPSYHPVVIDVVAEAAGEGQVVDLGAGTGISTAALVDRGLDVIAIEPVEAMRERLRANVPEAQAASGTAEDIPVPSASVSAVVVAQAFHWFDHGPALDEITRVLEPDGHLITLWNVRDESVPWVAKWTKVVGQFADGTPRYRDMAWRKAIEADARFALAQEAQQPNPQPSGPDQVVARALSVSFIARLEQNEQAQVEAQIRSVVAGMGDHFAYPYWTEAQIWRRNPS